MNLWKRLSSALRQHRVRVPSSKPPSPIKYNMLVNQASETLFAASILAAARIKQNWPTLTQGNDLTSEMAWKIQIEMLWYLTGTIVREIYLLPTAGPAYRDIIQDDLVSDLIDRMIDKMFKNQPDVREENSQRLLRWYNEAEDEFGFVHQLFASEEEVAQMLSTQEIPLDNLLGKCAHRIARVTGQVANIELAGEVFLLGLEAYRSANVPALTVSLVEACRKSERAPV